jgi:hypothetical protein
MRLARRVGRLEAPEDGRLPPWARELAAEVALAQGLEPAEVIVEAEAVLAQAAAAGVLGSRAGWMAFLAAEGADPDALLAEAERWLGRR